MASEVKEETNSTPSDNKNEVDEKVKGEDSKVKDGEKDGSKKDSKDEIGKGASEESKNKKEEDEDEEEDEDDEEEEVGLLDRPVEVTGCRARKKVERLDVSFSTPKEKQEFHEGKGKKLGDCPRIELQILKSKVPDLKPLHKILFNRTGSVNEIKKNIRKFSGFPFEEDSVEFNRKKASLEKMTMSVLKKVCLVLDIERGGSKKGDIMNRILNFLMKPEDSGKKVPVTKKKASKDKKASTKKGKSDKKSKVDKSENSAEESEKSDDDEEDDDSTGGDASMGGTDEENEAENESDEEPKKKSKDVKPSKGKSKADKVKKEEKKSKGTKRKADEDSKGSSDDEPVAKKSKMPTDEEISKLVKQILESADLQEITMKKVIKQVSDAYPDFDLSHKKAFIKQTIKSVIS